MMVHTRIFFGSGRSVARWSGAVLALCLACESKPETPAVVGAAASSSPAASASGALSPASAASPQASAPSLARENAAPPTLGESIERAARYFAAQPMHGDQLLLVGQGSALLSKGFLKWAGTLSALPGVVSDATIKPSDGEGAAGIEGALWRARTSPRREWKAAAKPPDLGPLASDIKLDDADLQEFYALMRATVACKPGDARATAKLKMHVVPPRAGYLLTHQLFAVAWARDRKCIGAVQADTLRLELGIPTYRELLADGAAIHDLSVERMAMLCYAGLCAWLTDAHVDALLASQAADGSWGERSVNVHPSASMPAGHTAALAFYVLASRWRESRAAGDAPRPPGGAAP